MGFFSARRTEDFENYTDHDPSVVRVIRSKFYGKPKGKEREVDRSFYTASANAASTASFATNKPADKRSVAGSIRGPRTSTSTSRNWTASSSTTSPRRPGNVSDMSSSRSSADVITVTLAQRLNELATANSEGLLSDDEYRLLRQNLFERFASGSSVPAEAPLVPMSKPAQSTAEPRNSTSHQRRPSSNFHVQTSSLRAASIQSKKSFTSTVTGLLRRATSRRIVSASADANGGDSMSVYSMASSPPERTTLPRRLSKQASDISLHSEISSSRLSQSHSRRTIIGNHTFSATDPGPARTRTRSGSRAPPSAFPGVPKASDPYTHISPVDIPDDDTVESVQDIRHQIELVEAEGRRLLDAFNGLELSTLTRRQRKPPVIPPIPSHGSLSDPTWLNGDKRSIRGGKDSDAVSYKSNGSGRTTMSMKRSPSIGGKMRTVNSVGTLVSQHAVMRKGSFSSVSSRGRTAPPSLPNLASHLGLGSSSSVNLARSTGHLPLETVEETEGNPPKLPAAMRSAGSRRDSRWTETASMGSSNPISPAARSEAGSTGTGGRRGGAAQVDDEDLASMEAELADIRRRRAEVTARYESRLEYLRARLKGAELREKLLRK